MERIETLLRNYIKSINECDIELAKSIWDTEGSVSLIHPKGYEYSFEDIKTNFYIGIMNKQFLTRYYGNTALVEFIWDFYALSQITNEEIHTRGRETQFIVLRDNGWKISNIHYSTIS